ncbi:hypothetical protein GJAV_G00040780 [Gymnothorax javanicus]|nr:hypothetical protein GJAV_G00040780 [Gymnothorax javanicus]
MLIATLMMENEEELEVLGEKLYDLIYPRHADIAGKLTGMLLELPGPVIKQILQDEAMLTEALNKALSALQLTVDGSERESQSEDQASTSSDSLGEQLYNIVEVYNTGLTEKITGMLLDQKKLEVQKLLSDPGLLEARIKLALKILDDRESPEETDMSDFSDPDDTEKLGEKLFVVVQQIDAEKCADITGMLLEMDHETLKQVLNDRALLEVAVQKAQSALLEHESQFTSELD